MASEVSSPRSVLGPGRWKWQALPKPNYLQIVTALYTTGLRFSSCFKTL